MELTSAALFLNSFFAGYDKAILTLMHALSKIGFVLTPLMKLITLLGEKGILFFLLAFVCMCFARSRKFGVCVFGAVCCGALITNIILKDMIARPRPFETVELFNQWWQAVGAPAEDGFSFPSGHVTAAAAGMTAICLMKGKKWITPSVIWVLLMAMSRNYLMAHYPSDVLVASIVGLASGFIAWMITKLIFKFLESHAEIPLFAFALEFDIGDYLPLDGIFERIGGVKDLLPRKGEPEDTATETDSKTYAPTTRRTGSHAAATAEKTPSAKKFKMPGVNTYKGKHEKR